LISMYTYSQVGWVAVVAYWWGAEDYAEIASRQATTEVRAEKTKH